MSLLVSSESGEKCAGRCAPRWQAQHIAHLLEGKCNWCVSSRVAPLQLPYLLCYAKLNCAWIPSLQEVGSCRTNDRPVTVQKKTMPLWCGYRTHLLLCGSPVTITGLVLLIVGTTECNFRDRRGETNGVLLSLSPKLSDDHAQSLLFQDPDSSASPIPPCLSVLVSLACVQHTQTLMHQRVCASSSCGIWKGATVPTYLRHGGGARVLMLRWQPHVRAGLPRKWKRNSRRSVDSILATTDAESSVGHIVDVPASQVMKEIGGVVRWIPQRSIQQRMVEETVEGQKTTDSRASGRSGQECHARSDVGTPCPHVTSPKMPTKFPKSTSRSPLGQQSTKRDTQMHPS